jgi:hypothetical protein
MRAVWAIAGSAIRSALRSRVVLVLLLLLLAVIIALPATIRGDGTPEGWIRILIGYTLGAAFFILAAATIWSGCAAISTEIAEQRIELVLSKPVGRAQVWLGHWLGLVALHAALLTVSGLVVYGLMQWRLSRMPDGSDVRESLLVSLRSVEPERIDPGDRARRLLEERERSGSLPADLDRRDALQMLRADVVRREWSVGPGLKKSWTYRLPRPIDPDETLRLRVQFASSRPEREPVRGLWRAGPPEDPDRFRAVRDWHPGLHTLDVPASVLDGGTALAVSFANIHPVPATVFFDPQEGTLLAPAGRFEYNFARAVLALFLTLAFLAALAVSAGAVFSLPVAGLVCAYAVILLTAGDYIRSMAAQRSYFGSAQSPGGPTAWFDAVFRVFFRAMEALVAPLQGPDVLDLLTSGRLVSWSLIGALLGFRLLLGGGLIAAAGIFLFHRREAGRPMG